MAHQVFISYSSKDREAADAVLQALETSGISCWIAPRDVTPGVEYAQEIVEAIEGSKFLLLILSASSNDSSQVIREVERAVSKKVPILPFRIEDIGLSKSMEYFVSSHHWFDASNKPLSQHLPKLVESLQKRLATMDGQEAPAAAVATTVPPSPVRSSRKPLWLAVAAALVILVVAVYWFVPGRDSGSGAGGQVFDLILQGQAGEAEKLLSARPEKDALYYQGLTAVFLSRGDLAQAQANLALASQAAPDDPALLVLTAEMAFSNGRMEEAEAGFQKALDTQTAESWEKAEAHFGLGRILRTKGSWPQAVEAFDQALALAPKYAQAHTAKGLALERLGQVKEALGQFQTASQLIPGDPVSALLYQRTKQKIEAEESAQQRERVDALVDDLAQAFRQGQTGAPEDRDEWSSRPLTVFCLELTGKGQPPVWEGEDVFLSEKLAMDLTSDPRLQQVERVLLDRLLEELKLGSSELSDPQTALRLGKIMSARLLIAGTAVRYKGKLQVMMRAIDVETTKVVATASAVGSGGQDVEEVADRLGRDFVKKVLAAYPRRGRVVEVRGDAVLIDIGRRIGVEPGLKLAVKEEAAGDMTLEVKEADEETCLAVPDGQGAVLEKGWRVEETTG